MTMSDQFLKLDDGRVVSVKQALQESNERIARLEAELKSLQIKYDGRLTEYHQADEDRKQAWAERDRLREAAKAVVRNARAIDATTFHAIDDHAVQVLRDALAEGGDD